MEFSLVFMPMVQRFEVISGKFNVNRICRTYVTGSGPKRKNSDHPTAVKNISSFIKVAVNFRKALGNKLQIIQIHTCY
jgi:hypothetical protein